MKHYGTGSDLRTALEFRLKREADDSGTDLGRLRRRVVFDRLATRLAADQDHAWILKGGAALEFRLYPRARATKDLDFALSAQGIDGKSVRDLLIDCLIEDVGGDWFSFEVSQPTELALDAAGRAAWRFSVQANLGGRQFACVRLDVANRSEELSGTERLRLPGTLSFAGIACGTIEAVDRHQHFAEKLHALTRDYGHRPNTRVKDLVDLVLLIEDGLEPNPCLVRVVEHVFTVRSTHSVPEQIDQPPPLWVNQYPNLAEDLTTTRPDLQQALALVRNFWTMALAQQNQPERN
ncbi:nucleotidyl transferase AbiEii/AbiGii toxin family protein [Nocardia sp. NPDC058658]|uniref:nucleotidyl transferase AbiEii/AbiGii toxin family protein n=1 Tax=Nocardia sp. NPDC058658 TaxID=3346580 RepID=UPI00364E3C80